MRRRAVCTFMPGSRQLASQAHGFKGAAPEPGRQQGGQVGGQSACWPVNTQQARLVRAGAEGAGPLQKGRSLFSRNRWTRAKSLALAMNSWQHWAWVGLGPFSAHL